MEQDFIPVMPSYVSFQMLIRVPLIRARLWIPVPRLYFRRRVKVFMGDVGGNLEDTLVGMALTDGKWVLNDGRNAFRIRSF
jgi:hypothetical protein